MLIVIARIYSAAKMVMLRRYTDWDTYWDTDTRYKTQSFVNQLLIGKNEVLDSEVGGVCSGGGQVRGV